MRRPTLVLVSAALGRGAALRLARRHRPFGWLYFGENTSRMLRWRGLLGGEGQVLMGRATVERARTLLPSYLSWVSSLGEHKRSNPFWWLTEISERNIYCPQKLLLNLTYLGLWRDLVSEQREAACLVVVESTALLDTLALNRGGREILTVERGWRRLLRRAAFPVRLVRAKARYAAGALVRWALARWHDGPPPRRLFDPGRPNAIVHTWANAAQRPDRPFSENYFGVLPEWLRGRGWNVILVPWFFRRTSYRRYLAEARRSPIPALVPERLLTPGDLLRAAVLPVFRGWLPRGRRFAWEGMDVSPLVREARRLQAISSRASDALLHVFLARRLAAAGVRVDRVLHICESHIWEKALALGVRECFPGAEIVGYQHNALSEFETNYYLAPEEVGNASQPHRIVCLGPAWVKVLLHNGFDPRSLSAGAALRFAHLFDGNGLGRRATTPGGAPTILVTPGIDPQEALDTLVKVFAALGERGNLRVAIKMHPLLPPDLFRTAFSLSPGLATFPSHFSVAEGRFADWLRRADLLIYGGTTTGWEALIAGIPAVFVGRDCGLSFDPVRVEATGKLAAFTVQELTAAVDTLLAWTADDVARARQAGAAILGEWFTPVHDESLAEFGETCR